MARPQPRRVGDIGSAFRRGGSSRFATSALAPLAVICIVVGCGDETAQSAPVEPASVRILRPEAEQAADAEADQSDGPPVVAESDRLEGLIVNPYDLDVGQCFNSYPTALGDGEYQELTTVVDCAGPHDGEVYFQTMHPAEAGEPFPGDAAMEMWAQQRCYEQFEPFVDQEYELSDLAIDTLRPTDETWSHPSGRHREVTCYLEAWRGGRLLGSMQQSGF